MILIVLGFLFQILINEVKKNRNNLSKIFLPELNDRYELGLLMESLKGKEI